MAAGASTRGMRRQETLEGAAKRVMSAQGVSHRQERSYREGEAGSGQRTEQEMEHPLDASKVRPSLWEAERERPRSASLQQGGDCEWHLAP